MYINTYSSSHFLLTKSQGFILFLWLIFQTSLLRNSFTFSLLLWTKHVTVNEVCVLKTLFLIFFACNWCRSNNLSPENDCWEFFIISNFFFVKWKQKILELLHILQNVYKNNCNDNVFFWKTVCSIWKWKELWISKHLVTIFRGI